MLEVYKTKYRGYYKSKFIFEAKNGMKFSLLAKDLYPGIEESSVNMIIDKNRDKIFYLGIYSIGTGYSIRRIICPDRVNHTFEMFNNDNCSFTGIVYKTPNDIPLTYNGRPVIQNKCTLMGITDGE